MLSIAPALGLLCLLFGPVPSFTAPTYDLAGRSFNPRQKWENDEVNCIQIFNPSPGASYHPGYFVRMKYGDQMCQGATAAGPWTIHLYNNPEIEQSGQIHYDYHEVLAAGLKEHNTQYVWTIPADHEAKAANTVKNANDYYVRIETNSQDGTKLVGNAGPFAIYSDQTLLKRDDDQPAALVSTTTTTAVTATTFIPEIPTTPFPAAEPNTLPIPDVVQTSPEPGVENNSPALDDTLQSPDSVTKLQVSNPPDYDFPSSPAPPLAFTGDIAVTPTVTPISSKSIIPNNAIISVFLAGGALAAGIVGGSYIGAIGAIVGAIVGGVLGGLIVAASYIGDAVTGAQM